MTSRAKQRASVTARFGTAATAAAVAALAATYLACGMFGGEPEQPMQSGSNTPAAEGTVEASAGANGNTALTVRVKHLAPPSKLESDATVYVVWIQAGDAPIQNVGAMTLNDDLEGRLDTVTPHVRFKVMVTPEPGAQGSEPTHEPVFTSDVERRD